MFEDVLDFKVEVYVYFWVDDEVCGVEWVCEYFEYWEVEGFGFCFVYVECNYRFVFFEGYFYFGNFWFYFVDVVVEGIFEEVLVSFVEIEFFCDFGGFFEGFLCKVMYVWIVNVFFVGYDEL